MPYGITQCYLPPDRGENPPLPPAVAGTRFSDQGCVDLCYVKADGPAGIEPATCKSQVQRPTAKPPHNTTCLPFWNSINHNGERPTSQPCKSRLWDTDNTSPGHRYSSTHLRDTSTSASCRLSFKASFSMMVMCSRFSRSETLREHSCRIVSRSISQVCSICCSRLHISTAHAVALTSTWHTLSLLNNVVQLYLAVHHYYYYNNLPTDSLDIIYCHNEL